MQSFKSCPRCKTIAPMQATACAGCGRPYRPRGADGQLLVETPAPPPRRRTSWAICIPIALVLLAAYLAVFRPGRATPSVTMAPERLEFVMPPVTANATSGPEAPQEPVTSEGPFLERPSDQEMPEIRVASMDREDGIPRAILFSDGTNEFPLPIRPGISSTSLPAGEYRYELHGIGYSRTGEPDQFGRFQCRKFKLYELTVGYAHGAGSVQKDMGDLE